jgi:hypothetical protein
VSSVINMTIFGRFAAGCAFAASGDATRLRQPKPTTADAAPSLVARVWSFIYPPTKMKGLVVDGASQQAPNSKTNHDGNASTLTERNKLFHYNPAFKGASAGGAWRTLIRPTLPIKVTSEARRQFVPDARRDIA